jgi:hypothetical protein
LETTWLANHCCWRFGHEGIYMSCQQQQQGFALDAEEQQAGDDLLE